MTSERLLVIVAHPDDETFGCGSFLAHAAGAGADITVVCATRGEAGEPAPGSGVESDALPAVRERELHTAAEFLGVGRVDLLDLRDSGMDGEPAPGTLCATPLDDVAVRLVDVIEALRPTVVVTLDGSDGHRDHIHMREATLLAVDRADWRTPSVYLHCLPQTLMRRWAELTRATAPDSAYLAVRELGTPEDEITTVIDTTEFLDRREAAIAMHASQTSPYEVMPEDLRRDFLSAERLRRVRPPWSGGPLETAVFSPSATADPAVPTPD